MAEKFTVVFTEGSGDICIGRVTAGNYQQAKEAAYRQYAENVGVDPDYTVEVAITYAVFRGWPDVAWQQS